MMTRRDALSRVALILGGTIIGADVFLSGCNTADKKISGALDFSADNIAFFDEVGETILPKTASSPGARSAKIGEFMKTIVTDCYTEADQKIFAESVAKLNEASNKKFSEDFMKLTPQQRTELLTEIDKEAKTYSSNKKDGDPNHYFTMLKQLTVWGYFSSKEGATQALRYVAVPGKYDGSFPYKKGDKAWAT